MFLLFAGCTVILQNAAVNDQVAKLNRGLIDSLIVDTLPMQKKYNEYLAGCITENRKYPEISRIFNSVSSDLMITLLPFIESNKLKTVDTLNLLIKSNGVAICTGFPSNRTIDTILVQDVNKKLSNVSFGMTKDSNFTATIQIIIKKDYENGTINVSDKIRYSNDGRSRASVQKVIVSYIDKMKALYNRRLLEKNGLTGKITVKFLIDPYGRVVQTSIVKSTVKDTLLEQSVLQQIMHWKFEHILSETDLTTCVYPFVFSQ
jgi:TonB family protein